MTRRPTELGDLQLAVLRVLWARPGASVQDVHEVLARTRTIATTTVATILGRLAERGLVSRTKQGRQFRWTAEVDEAQTTGALVGDLTERVFQGKAADLVCQLLEGGQFDAGDLDRVRALLDARRAEMEDEGATPGKASDTKRAGRKATRRGKGA